MSKTPWTLAITLIAMLCATTAQAQAPSTGSGWISITGRVIDTATGQPVPFATVHLVGTGRAATANDSGQYRIFVAAGDSCRLKFSHIAYYSGQSEIIAADSNMVIDAWLKPTLIEVNTIRVIAGVRDPGEAIILEAIKRKQEILNRLHDYRFDAYTKLVVRGKKKDTSRIFLITETQVSSFWEQPDKYKEIITARKQTKNLPPDANLVTVGDILNFNKDRIDLGDDQVVSPTAHDALDHYRFYLLDTLYIDSSRVFVIDVEPRTDAYPLFVGQIQIADSTYDVVGVDFGFNAAFHPPMLSELRYTQRFAQFLEKYWMPIEIRFSGRVKLPFPLPGIPSEMTFEHVASLYSYQFDQGTPPGTFGEIAREVAPDADKLDSADWAARQTIPLTSEETYGYERIDSIQKAPKPIHKQLLRALIVLPLFLGTQEQFFHFNRVEGAYLGAGATIRPNARLAVGLRAGYAFELDRGQGEGRISYLLHQSRALQLEFMYHRRVVHRPTFYYAVNKNMTMPALAEGSDPFDYFDERGYLVQLSGKLVNHTRFIFGYHHYRQRSLERRTNYSLWNESEIKRENPAIADGHLRAVSAEFRYDSRPMYRLKGRDVYGEASAYTQFSLSVERSSPRWLDSDFDYTRLSMRFFRRQHSLGLGPTSLLVAGGTGTRGLPPQRYFTVPFSPMNEYLANGIQTLAENNFGGSRALSVTLRHEFGTRLFRWSGLPLIKRLPMELSVHSGVFWTDFDRHLTRPGDENIRLAREPFYEVGFGLEQVIPFLAPIKTQLYFTWQLSDYPQTHQYNISWEFGL